MAEEQDAAGYIPFPSFAEWGEAVSPADSVDAFEELLAEARRGANSGLLDAAIQRLTEYAAIETGALEGLYEAGRGFTRTVAAEGAVLEAISNERGAEVARTVRDQLEAFELMLDMATQSRPVTELFIREIHQTICRSQATYRVWTGQGAQERDLPLGEYKTFPNNPSRTSGEVVHLYAPVTDTAPEMARLVAELSTDEFAVSHPVVQAAYAHFALVAIHPFADGNGRVARALASIFTYRRPGVPVLIFDDEKDVYLDALEAADRRQFQPFVDFMGDRVVEAVQLIQEQLETAASQPESETLNRLARTLRAGIGELSHAQADALASEILDAATQIIQAWISDTDLPEDVQVSAFNLASIPREITASTGYRLMVNNPRRIGFGISVNPPANAHVQTQLVPFVSTGVGALYDFALQPVSQSNEIVGRPFGMRLSELRPSPKQALLIRMKSFIQRLLAQGLEEVSEQAENSLRQAGFKP